MSVVYTDTTVDVVLVYSTADLASRGVYPQDICKVEGPPWLILPPKSSPKGKVRCPKGVPGLKNPPMMTIQIVEDMATQFSSHRRLIQTVAWVLRFIKNLKLSANQRMISPHLSLSDISQAEVRLLHLHQLQHFPEELAGLKKSQHVPRSSHSILSWMTKDFWQ